jgi:hypothetical protein
MELLPAFLNDVRTNGYASGNFLGLLHLLIGRRIATRSGELISSGLTWRETATWLKKMRWSKEAVRELGLDPQKLPARDRIRFWYSAIARAGVDSAAAVQAGKLLAAQLKEVGFQIGSPPRQGTTPSDPPG